MAHPALNPNAVAFDPVEVAMESVLDGLGLHWSDDPQMRDTPVRVARMYREVFAGLREPEPKITVFPNTKGYNEMVFLGPIVVRSMCSHHLLPFYGSAYVAYIPKASVVGISKIVRIVRWFAARPQIQEELTQQIVDYLVQKLDPIGAAVLLRCTHTCMTIRGVQEDGSSQMATSAVRGILYEEAARREFFDLVKRSRG